MEKRDTKKPTLGFWAAVVAVALLVIYLGVYLTLVQRRVVARLERGDMNFKEVVGTFEADYRWPGAGSSIQTSRLHVVFRPLHSLDRQLRAEMWRKPTLGELHSANLPLTKEERSVLRKQMEWDVVRRQAISAEELRKLFPADGP